MCMFVCMSAGSARSADTVADVSGCGTCSGHSQVSGYGVRTAGHAEGVARRSEVSARSSGHSQVSVTLTH